MPNAWLNSLTHPALWVAGGIALGAAGVWAAVVRTKRVRREPDVSDVAAEEFRNTCAALTAELESLAARVEGSLSDQFARLDRVKAEIDRRIARLEVLSGAADCPGETGNTIVNPDPPIMRSDAECEIARNASDADNVARATESAPATASRKGLGLRRAERLAGGPIASDESRPTLVKPLSPTGNSAALRERVYELADAGVSPIDIAQRCERSLGEVDFVLRLRGFAEPRAVREQHAATPTDRDAIT